MKRFKLPEKDYFTREELAARWDCDLSLVEYYISHGMLREAIYTQQESCFSLQVCPYLRIDIHSKMFQKHRNDVFNFESFVELAEAYDIEVTSENVSECPKFAYVSDPAAFFTEIEPGPFSLEETEGGYEPKQRTRIVFLQGFGDDRYIPITRLKKGQKISADIWYFADVYADGSVGESMIIPREERDRFEADTPIGERENLANNSGGGSVCMTHTTESGYLVTIGMLARALGQAEMTLLKTDGTVNVKGMAQYLESESMSLEGHRTEALKKRISAGLKALKNLS